MTEARTTRVAVNGYGVIGKRVAAAVVRQEDMSLTGVSDVVTRPVVQVAETPVVWFGLSFPVPFQI